MLHLKKSICILLLSSCAWLITYIPFVQNASYLDIDFLHYLDHLINGSRDRGYVSDTVIVAIDERTSSREDFSGVPKVLWTPQFAAIQNAILDGGAKVIGWDVILSTSGQNFDRPLLKSLLVHGKKEGRVVLGQAEFPDRIISPHQTFRIAVGGNENIRSLLSYTDPDGVIRTVPMILQQKNGKAVPSFSLDLANRSGKKTLYTKDENTNITLNEGIPVNQHDALQLNFTKQHQKIPFYSFGDLFSCAEANNPDFFTKHFKDKIVLFGLVNNIDDRKLLSNRFIHERDFSHPTETCQDSYPPAPEILRHTSPGVLIHATAINNLVNKEWMRNLDTKSQAAVIILSSFIVGLFGLYLRPKKAVLLSSLHMFGYFGIAMTGFNFGLLFPLTKTVVASTITLIIANGFRYLVLDKERRLIRHSFSKYLSDRVIAHMLQKGHIPELGGERRYLTVIFTDIANFTALSETISPKELVSFLNQYFEIVGQTIDKHGGFIERFLGDAIVAVYGAPVPMNGHATEAIKTALEVQDALNKANFDIDLPSHLTLGTRFGINTGNMVIGNVGSERRFTYTVMGDATNLAARLESLNKQYDSLILAGEETYQACQDEFIWLMIDHVQVVGRQDAEKIYTPLGPNNSTDMTLQSYKTQYETAYNLYQSGQFQLAADAFASIQQEASGPHKVLQKRCEAFIYNPPDEKWSGIYKLSKK